MTCFIPDVLEEFRTQAGQFRRLSSLDRLGRLDRAIQRFLDLDCTIAVERTILDLEMGKCHGAIGTDGSLTIWGRAV